MRIRKATDKINKEEVELIAAASDALAHPARVEIFRFIYAENLARRPVCNKDIVENFPYAQATVSQHIARLVSSGLVDPEKKGNKSFYYVNIGILGKYLNAVKKLNEI